jgi:apolipoprotein N-acyltransferase
MARHEQHQRTDDPQTAKSLQTLYLSVVAGALMWASFAPLDWFLLAWFVPTAWARLIQPKKMQGCRPYWTIWAVSAVTWAILLEGVGRAYWANYFALVLIGAYLALYQVLFVVLSRVAVHRWKVSIVIAAPTVWTGLELARGYVITGFSMALLGHTQVRVTPLIQIADLFGAYGVSFLIVFVGACIARSLPQNERRWTTWPTVAAVGTLVCVLVYGRVQMQPESPSAGAAQFKVALIQGTEDTILDSDLDAARQRSVDTFMQYWRLMLDAVAEHDDIDLVVWPEGVFSGNVPQLVIKGAVTPPPGSGLTPDEVAERIEQRTKMFEEKILAAAKAINQRLADGAKSEHATYLLTGCDAVELSGVDQSTYNAGLLIDPSGAIAGRYDKMHRVMIGEYTPLGDYLPWLYNLNPIGRGLTAGSRPVSLDVQGINVSPSICFEDTVPHLIRRQVRELTEQGDRPDVLINLTNDGWFWGSAILDLQLSCAIFRAVELRRPMLVAANTGLTASIDSNGIVRETLPRRKEGVVVDEVVIRRRSSLYEYVGDLFAGLCLMFCVALAGSGCLTQRRS